LKALDPSRSIKEADIAFFLDIYLSASINRHLQFPPVRSGR